MENLINLQENDVDDSGSINENSGEESVRKEQAQKPGFGHFNENSVYTHSDDKLGKKKEVNKWQAGYMC